MTTQQRKGLALIASLAFMASMLGIASIFENKQQSSNTDTSSVPPKPPSPLTAKEIHGQNLRYGARATIEDRLLSAGYDVQVGWLANSTDRDTTLQLMIIGTQVNRPFVHNLLGPGLRRSLKRDGFTKILFCRKSIGDWIAEYNPQYNNLTWY